MVTNLNFDTKKGDTKTFTAIVKTRTGTGDPVLKDLTGWEAKYIMKKDREKESEANIIEVSGVLQSPQSGTGKGRITITLSQTNLNQTVGKYDQDIFIDTGAGATYEKHTTHSGTLNILASVDPDAIGA